MGHWKLTQATTRVRALATGYPFPEAGVSRPIGVMALSITAAYSNAGTIFIRMGDTALAGITCVAAGRGATIKNKTMIPLLKGQTYSFTGMGVGGPTPRTMLFGTGRTYLYASATGQVAICTYMEQA